MDKNNVKNVIAVKGDAKSYIQLQDWINRTLDGSISHLNEISNGAAYCQLIHKLFPSAINLKKVKFDAVQRHHCVSNYKILQAAFNELKIDQDVPVDALMEGGINGIEFASWFYKFYHKNIGQYRNYDAAGLRNNMPVGKTAIKPDQGRKFDITVSHGGQKKR